MMLLKRISPMHLSSFIPKLRKIAKISSYTEMSLMKTCLEERFSLKYFMLRQAIN